MARALPEVEASHRSMPLGRVAALIGDEVTCSLVVLEFVFRSEDITVWWGERTLAVMDRTDFFGWLWSGGDYAVDDLQWSVQQNQALVTIEARDTYALDENTVAQLAQQTGYAAITPAGRPQTRLPAP